MLYRVIVWVLSPDMWYQNSREQREFVLPIFGPVSTAVSPKRLSVWSTNM